MKKAIIGFGGFAREVEMLLLDNNPKEIINFFVDDEYANEIAKPISSINIYEYEVVIAIADGLTRKRIVESLPKETNFFNAIHKSVQILDSNIQISEGAIICSSCILTTGVKIGKHAQLNLQTTIGHGTNIGDYFTTAPGVKISGDCKIGNNVYFGSNSVIKEKIKVCDNVKIGALGCVLKDILTSGTYVGIPVSKILKRKKIALTITSCKRLDLFIKTIISFCKKCKDINQINSIIHYDDSSTDEDRMLMQELITSLFPNSDYILKSINPLDIISNHRHMEIMKIWKNDIEEFDYIFHLEDDWFFERSFSISEAIDLMEHELDVAYVGFSWEMKNFPPKIFSPKIIGNFWEWYYSEKYELCEPLFIDDVETKYLPEGHWVKYINWPYFGLRPGVHNVERIKNVSTFSEKNSSFELEFATRFAKLYKSFLHKERVCRHIGLDVSSYELNNSNR
jgi:sugar O-acyltransferase (sialic acid O-acetyltransferase NeuD family)